ncbi:MAG: SPOR domain-containing protein [Bradyrhizobium sp.]
MADRYQDRPFPAADDYDRGANPNAPAKGDSDPLAELARLIGQTDPFGTAAKPPPHPLQSRANVRPTYGVEAEEEASAPAGPPPWMQRARHDAPPQQQYDEPEPEYQPSPVHPLHRYAAQQPAAHEQDYHEPAQQYADEQPVDPSRYDDALYGQLESGQQEYARDPAFPDDPYAYQSGYEEEPEPKKRSNGLMTVAAVLVLAVVGTGAAFAYRTYVGSPRSGEPPIIKADNSPTKVMAPSDGSAGKTPDRMTPGDGGEKIVSREETPVDVNSRSGPRVVFPPLNQNGNPPPVSSVSPAAPPPVAAANGTLPNNEPRKIKTLAVKGDADNGGVPAGVAAPAKQAPAARTLAPAPAAAPAPRNPSSANASANGPLSLAPGGINPDPASTRMAATNPVQPAPSGGGGYLVQVSSQKNEADAQASYRALQGKFPSVLGSRAPVIKRADLGDKGVFYRAMVGPFGSTEEAASFCGNLKTAGGQCVVQRN